jgi:hypothetical protein
MLLELKPLIDRSELVKLYADPYIARVGHDHRPASPIHHPDAYYLGAYADGALMGAFLIIHSGFIEYDIHALLRRDALTYSRQFGRLCLAHVFTDPQIQRATGYIIDGLTTARNYCLKLGFKDEGYRRNACMKNGKLVGVQTLGITRNDWEASK